MKGGNRKENRWTGARGGGGGGGVSLGAVGGVGGAGGPQIGTRGAGPIGLREGEPGGGGSY